MPPLPLLEWPPGQRPHLFSYYKMYAFHLLEEGTKPTHRLQLQKEGMTTPFLSCLQRITSMPPLPLLPAREGVKPSPHLLLSEEAKPTPFLPLQEGPSSRYFFSYRRGKAHAPLPLTERSNPTSGLSPRFLFNAWRKPYISLPPAPGRG